MIGQIIKYITHSLPETKEQHPVINEKIIKSALVYQYLFHYHFVKHITINEIINNHPDIGLLGPNKHINNILERLFNGNHILCWHSVLHDSFGRFYNDYKKDRGYIYAFKIPDYLTFLKGNMFLGQISGIIYCIIYLRY